MSTNSRFSRRKDHGGRAFDGLRTRIIRRQENRFASLRIGQRIRDRLTLEHSFREDDLRASRLDMIDGVLAVRVRGGKPGLDVPARAKLVNRREQHDADTRDRLSIFSRHFSGNLARSGH